MDANFLKIIAREREMEISRLAAIKNIPADRLYKGQNPVLKAIRSWVSVENQRAGGTPEPLSQPKCQEVQPVSSSGD